MIKFICTHYKSKTKYILAKQPLVDEVSVSLSSWSLLEITRIEELTCCEEGIVTSYTPSLVKDQIIVNTYNLMTTRTWVLILFCVVAMSPTVVNVTINKPESESSKSSSAFLFDMS